MCLAFNVIGTKLGEKINEFKNEIDLIVQINNNLSKNSDLINNKRRNSLINLIKLPFYNRRCFLSFHLGHMVFIHERGVRSLGTAKMSYFVYLLVSNLKITKNFLM